VGLVQAAFPVRRGILKALLNLKSNLGGKNIQKAGHNGNLSAIGSCVKETR
jgi:hypothetical protein